jgi:hypothetical protein
MHFGYDVFDPSIHNLDGVKGDSVSLGAVNDVNPYDFEDDGSAFLSNSDYHYNSIDAIFGEKIRPTASSEMKTFRKENNMNLTKKQHVSSKNKNKPISVVGQRLGKTKLTKKGASKSSTSAMAQKIINLKSKISEHRFVVSEIRLRVKQSLEEFYTFEKKQQRFSMIPIDSMNEILSRVSKGNKNTIKLLNAVKDILDDTTADIGTMIDDEIVLYENNCQDLSDSFGEYINVCDNRTERLSKINKDFVLNAKKLLDKSNEKKIQQELDNLQNKYMEAMALAKTELQTFKKDSNLHLLKMKNEHEQSLNALKLTIENKTKDLKRVSEKLESETLAFQQREVNFNEKLRELEHDLQSKVDRIDGLQIEIDALTSRSVMQANKNEQIIIGLKTKVEELKVERDQLSQEIKNMECKNESAKEEMIKELDQTNLCLQQEVSTLKINIEDAKKVIKETSEELNLLKIAMQNKEDILEKLEVENTNLENKIRQQSENAVLFETKLQEQVTYIAAIEDEITKEKQNNEKLCNMYEAKKDQDLDKVSVAEQLKKEIASLREKLVLHEKIMTENSALTSKVNELKTTNKKMKDKFIQWEIVKQNEMARNDELENVTGEITVTNTTMTQTDLLQKCHIALNTYISGEVREYIQQNDKKHLEKITLNKMVQANVKPIHESTRLNTEVESNKYHTSQQTIQMAKEMNILLTYIRTHRMRLLDMWNKFDIDGDGFVTKAEFLVGMKGICTEVNLDISDELLALVFEEGDVDVSIWFMLFIILIIYLHYII